MIKKDRQGKNMMRGLAILALALAFVCTPLHGAMAHGEHGDANAVSQDSNIKHFIYDFNANKITSSTYEDVRAVMAPIFKGTYADINTPFYTNPMIATAEFDLNGDDVAEIIARPIDTEDDGDVFCGDDLLCPNYILSGDGKKLKIISVIRAMRVDRGDSIKNGYWTLKAFTKQNEPENFTHFEVFAFDPESGTYVQEKRVAPTESQQTE